MVRKQPKRKLRPGVDEYGRTPLHNALVPLTRDVDFQEIAALLNQGVDPNAADDAGFTPLHFAAQEALPDAARLLLEAGADPNIKDWWGNPPLFRAKMSEQGVEVIKILLDAGADPFISNNYGVSAADVAFDCTADDSDVARCIQDAAALFRGVQR